jgi:hypothetical protein
MIDAHHEGSKWKIIKITMWLSAARENILLLLLFPEQLMVDIFSFVGCFGCFVR